MNKCVIFGMALWLASATTALADEVLCSPNGDYRFIFSQQDGRLAYSLDFQDMAVVTHGELGVDVNNHLVEWAMGISRDEVSRWTSGMALQAVDRSHCDTTWTPLYGEQATIRDCYNEMTLRFVKGSDNGQASGSYNKQLHYQMDIVVRAYDEGVALRYHFPESGNGLFLNITGERTSFGFAPGTKACHSPWAQAPQQWVDLEPAQWQQESDRPTLLRLANGLSVALLEAGLHDFVRAKLRLTEPGTLAMSMHSQADVIPPYDMPWRVIMVGRQAVDLINHKQMVLCLNAPAQGDFSFVKPGRAFRCCRLENKWIRASIDFASKFGIEYVELDAGWYGPEMKMSSSAMAVSPKRDFTMPDVCAYAKSKGVGIWLYVNQRALYQQLDSLLPLYRKWGVKGIKFGFVQVGNQYWTRWLHQAVSRCADYGLMVDIHDEYRPTGWSRTYPNLLTQEGIHGNEEMPDATQNLLQPFTRYLCGPADYTLCYFNNRIKTTHAHQLAMAVVYYSPLQFLFWYDMPNAYQGQPELDFWKHCPTVWAESRALSGEPGQYIVQARRTEQGEWFVGCMTGTQERDITIDTSLFLEKGKRYQAEIYTDDPSLNTPTKVACQSVKVKAGKTISLHLQPSGGAALRFVPIG